MISRYTHKLLIALSLLICACTSPVQVDIVGVQEFGEHEPDATRMVLMLMARAKDPAQEVESFHLLTPITLEANNGQRWQSLGPHEHTDINRVDLRFDGFPEPAVFLERPCAEQLLVKGSLKVKLREASKQEKAQLVRPAQATECRVGRHKVRVSWTRKPDAPAHEHEMHLESDAELGEVSFAEEDVQIKHYKTSFFGKNKSYTKSYRVTTKGGEEPLHLLLSRAGDVRELETPVKATLTTALPRHGGCAVIPSPGPGIESVTITRSMEQTRRSPHRYQPWNIKVSLPLSTREYVYEIKSTKPLRLYMADGSSAAAQSSTPTAVYSGNPTPENAIRNAPNSVWMDYGFDTVPTSTPLRAEGEIQLTLSMPTKAEAAQEISLTRPSTCYVGGSPVKFIPKREPAGTPPGFVLGAFDPTIPAYTLTVESEVLLSKLILHDGKKIVYIDRISSSLREPKNGKKVYTLRLFTHAKKLSVTLGSYAKKHTKRIPVQVEFSTAPTHKP